MDGAFVPWAEANVHVLTHTLHYGVGVFEGIRCYACEDGRSAIFRLPEHNERLFDSAHILGLRIPFSPEEIIKACIDTVQVNRLKECYLRPIVFVGEGDRGLHAKSNPIHVAIAAWPWGAYLGEEGLKYGIRVKTSSFQRFNVNTLMTKAKAVGTYLNAILAGKEVWDLGYDEALLLDTDGYIAEGPGENIFVVRKGIVKTPPLSSSILPGITRDTVIILLRDGGYQVLEERITRDEVYIADEVFFTGTAAEVTPIREVDDRKIRGVVPGKVTKTLQGRFSDITKGRDKRYLHWLTFVE
ncbi:MAG: branched-chain amino acid transaminase [Deltaproteobacteria bacterium]|nr:branched-chain amino acid transaminase [Deltaproteobacteria bacterium]